MHVAGGRGMQVNESDKGVGVFCGLSEGRVLDGPPKSRPELEMGDVEHTSLPFLLTQCGIEQQNILGLSSSISKHGISIGLLLVSLSALSCSYL